VKYILILLHQAGVSNYHCMMHGTTKLKNCPKHVELTGIINKPLLLHLVGCLYYLYSIIFFGDLLNSLNLFVYRMSC